MEVNEGNDRVDKIKVVNEGNDRVDTINEEDKENTASDEDVNVKTGYDME
jgi:hypothetical protein